MFLLTLQSLHFSDMIATAFLHILQCVFALSALGINYYHESKTSLPKRWIISDLIWNGMFLHPLKAQFPIVVTLFGIFMFVRDSHPIKAISPIVVTLFGIFMLVRDSQSLNAPFPIVVTLFGIFMFVRDSQNAKAESPIVVTLFGIV